MVEVQLQMQRPLFGVIGVIRLLLFQRNQGDMVTRVTDPSAAPPGPLARLPSTANNRQPCRVNSASHAATCAAHSSAPAASPNEGAKGERGHGGIAWPAVGASASGPPYEI